MRRIKVILAVIAATATMMVLAAPAMAQSFDGGTSGNGSIDIGGPITGGLLVGNGGFDDDFGDCSGGCNEQSVISLGGSTIGGDVSFS
jgi:hypothetical protein